MTTTLNDPNHESRGGAGTIRARISLSAQPIRRGAAALIVGLLAVVLLGASPASATVIPSPTTYTPGSHGKSSANWDNYRNRAFGTADDITAGDARCTYVYGQGYNHFLRWGNWNQRARACAGGVDGWSETPTVYSDHYKISVCNGPAANPGSASNCTRRQIH